MRYSFRAHKRSGCIAVAGVLAAMAIGPAAAEDARHGMVVSAHRAASEAGVAILKAGGNAIDAAAAAGYALAVVDPCCGNIGGGGFMLIRRAPKGDEAGATAFINFRETAPAAATPDMYLDAAGNPIRDASRDGYRAVAVPGTVKGLDLALARYGRLKRTQVMAPAIALARNGFTLGEPDAAVIAHSAARLAADPEAARIFLHADGTPYAAGERLTQPELAATLERIAAAGDDGFYRGPVATALATPADAVAAPRFHHQYLPDTLSYETGGLPPATLSALSAMGYTLHEQSPWSAVELVAIAPDGTLTGINDPRRPAGAALGY